MLEKLQIEKLQALEDTFHELEARISDPAVMADMGEWQKLTKAHAKMAPVVVKFREFKQAFASIGEAREMLKEKLDEDFREMVTAELEEAKDKILVLSEELRVLLLPKDPNVQKRKNN